jgi:hypothetical protein
MLEDYYVKPATIDKVRVVKLTDAEAIEPQCAELSVVGKYFLCWYAARDVIYI